MLQVPYSDDPGNILSWLCPCVPQGENHIQHANEVKHTSCVLIIRQLTRCGKEGKCNDDTRVEEIVAEGDELHWRWKRHG